MNILKKITVIAVVLLIAATAVSAESFLNEDFSSFGINSIGIYTEGYEDERVDDFEATYLDAYMMQSVNTFRYTLCDYNAVTPKLMTPQYPLSGENSAAGDLNGMISEGVSIYAEEAGWAAGVINNFEGGSLAELRKKASADGYDAVLVARYYKVEYYIPFSNYSSTSGYSSTTTTANVGKLQSGLALLPALELYDVESGVRLWYSANWTGAPSQAGLDDYAIHNKNFENFFVSGNAPAADSVSTMVVTAMSSADFPAAALSGSRDEAAVALAGKSPHMLWTDYPDYEKFGTLLGVGYTYSYLGDFSVYYTAFNGTDDGELMVGGKAANAMLHSLNIPIFAIGTKNFSFEPAFYFGFMHSSGQFDYTETKYGLADPMDINSDIVVIDTDRTMASLWGATVGMDFTAKYYLRFNDIFSAYIGGRGLIEMWALNMDVDNEENISYMQRVSGLIQLEPFTLNASVTAGIRLDYSTPVDIFSIFTPIGAGGGLSISLGCNWHGATIGWTGPHAKNSEVLMYW